MEMTFARGTTRSGFGRTGSLTPRFWLHFAEMVGVMMLGMCLFGGILYGGLEVAGLRGTPGLASVGMALEMTVPMVLWMRFRGHSWARTSEMAVAMLLPLPAIALVWAGTLSEPVLLGAQHGLMVPSMLAAMLYRRDEYAQGHEGHAHA